jgi:hypothetical protein
LSIKIVFLFGLHFNRFSILICFVAQAKRTEKKKRREASTVERIKKKLKKKTRKNNNLNQMVWFWDGQGKGLVGIVGKNDEKL